MPTTPDELVRYVAGRLRWISPRGVEEVFKAARDFYATDDAPPARPGTKHRPRPAKSDLDAEQMVKRSMGYS